MNDDDDEPDVANADDVFKSRHVLSRVQRISEGEVYLTKSEYPTGSIRSKANNQAKWNRLPIGRNVSIKTEQPLPDWMANPLLLPKKPPGKQ